VITADRDAVLQLIPDGSTTISAQLQDEGAPAWSLRGPLLRPDARRFTAPTTVVGIRLRPGVAFVLTGIAMETLVDRRIDLTSLEPFRDLVAAEPRPRGLRGGKRAPTPLTPGRGLEDPVSLARARSDPKRPRLPVPSGPARA
jgi:hypothetical protein